MRRKGSRTSARKCAYEPPPADIRPSADDDWTDDFGHELGCTHCGGDGLCSDGADPLGNCGNDFHRCHACNGSGNRRDQTIF